MFNKKGYVRTLEAFFAFFATFIFLVFIVNSGYLPKTKLVAQDVLYTLEQNYDFRECIYAENTSCAEEIVDPYINSDFNFKVSINELESFTNSYDIQVEQLFIVGDVSRDFNIVKLYYWRSG
ncbi:hypothetical protein HOK51_02550 [Candidatus Woesearchaeota archaeon]|jgi:hypothetical protein|nr:hypothetical protein [Candidatus Woesearchaeota archaeon]MBT6518698.1 hypothetical protein [Candidatus Woesearchaeota archaeon]MBT7368380.1 hypothetical protein [Candidatus Woesearchaeota archaeon]